MTRIEVSFWLPEDEEAPVAPTVAAELFQRILNCMVGTHLKAAAAAATAAA